MDERVWDKQGGANVRSSEESMWKLATKKKSRPKLEQPRQPAATGSPKQLRANPSTAGHSSTACICALAAHTSMQIR